VLNPSGEVLNRAPRHDAVAAAGESARYGCKVNIPTVIELIGDDKIIDMLADEARKPWVNEATVLNDADMKRSELEICG